MNTAIFFTPSIRKLTNQQIEDLKVKIGELNALPKIKMDDPLIKVYNSTCKSEADLLNIGDIICEHEDENNKFINYTPRIIIK